MSHKPIELKNYRNQQLMDDFNNIMIRIKANLYYFDDLKLKNFPKPKHEELDEITIRIMNELRKDNEPLIKHKNDNY